MRIHVHVHTGICDNFIHSFREIFYLNILATINRQFLFLYLQRERFSKAYQMYYAIIDNYNFFFFFLETRNSMEIDGDRDNMFLKIE